MKILRNIILIIVALPLVLLILWVVCVTWSNAHPDIGRNVKSVAWLPQGATNISWYKTYSFSAFEFDIDEAGFMHWAGEMQYRPQRISQKFLIRRCTYLGNKQGEDGYVTITNGYFFLREFGESGGGISLAYDLNTGRAYCQFNPR